MDNQISQMLIDLHWGLHLRRHTWPRGHACFSHVTAGTQKSQLSCEKDDLRKQRAK